MARKIWYAVKMDGDDRDLGIGSECKENAEMMAEDLGDEAYIAVIDIDDDDSLCIAEIRRDEDGDWVTTRKDGE